MRTTFACRKHKSIIVVLFNVCGVHRNLMKSNSIRHYTAYIIADREQPSDRLITLVSTQRARKLPSERSSESG